MEKKNCTLLPFLVLCNVKYTLRGEINKGSTDQSSRGNMVYTNKVMCRLQSLDKGINWQAKSVIHNPRTQRSCPKLFLEKSRRFHLILDNPFKFMTVAHYIAGFISDTRFELKSFSFSATMLKSDQIKADCFWFDQNLAWMRIHEKAGWRPPSCQRACLTELTLNIWSCRRKKTHKIDKMQ